MVRAIGSVVLLAAFSASVAAAGATAPAAGLAARDPGDEGIEKDPAVLFVDDFETGSIEEIGAPWGNMSKPEDLSVTADLHGASPGTRSKRIAQNGHLFTHTKGVNTMYARSYVKFHEKTG